MGAAYKNFWSLNADEAVVAGIMRERTKRDIEVLIPLNAQMEGVDLYLINNKTKRVITIQVKGSRAYEPSKSEVRKFKQGSAGWFLLDKDVINKATADYFCFLIYVIEEIKKIGRRIIVPHVILIPIKTLQKKSLEKSQGTVRLNYKFWVNPITKETFDFSNKKVKRIDYSKFLDKNGFKIINKKLSKLVK